MADEPSPQITATDTADDIHAVESRLSPEAIAALDEMNKGFGGAQFGQPDPDPGAGDDAGKNGAAGTEGKVAAPDPKKAAAAPTSFDEFTPPDDAPVAPAKPDGKPVKEPIPLDKAIDFKAGADIMPDAEIEKLRTERQKTNIRDLRENYDKAVLSLKADRAKLEEMTKAGPDARVTELEARIAEYNSIIEQTALERHPWVIKTFVQPRQNAVDYGHKALELAKMDPKLLDRAMGASGEERIAALDELYASIESQTIRAKVEKAVTVIEATDDQRDAFFADREANFAKMKAQQDADNARTNAEQEKNCRTAVDGIVERLAKEGFSFLKFSDRPGAEQWNESLKKDLASATEKLLKNTDPMVLITNAILGERAPKMQIAFNRMRAKLAEYERGDANARAVTPKVNGDAPLGGARMESDPNEGLVAAGRRALREVTDQ